MRLASVISVLWLLASAEAQAVNENTTIVLHAVDTAFALCNQIQIDGTDCETVLPQVNVEGMSTPAIFVLLRNYDDVHLMQCAFDVPTSWVYAWGLWDCQGGLHPDISPHPPFGPTSGTVSYLFGDAIAGGTLATLGRMFFSSASSGCVTIVDSAFPYGTHVQSSSWVVTQVIPENRARICVGPGGYTACSPAVAVEPYTWGRIKDQFARRQASRHR
jgi:hypothetical protein